MKIIKPNKLKKGNTIGILAISGRIKNFENIEKAKSFFEEEGYKVVISETCKSSHRYMAGLNDDECINELHKFFSDKNIDVILCARGGYGTLRLIDKIDWELIKNNPKIFAGYSDITTLLNLIYKKTGLITFHSAMPNGDFSKEIDDYTKAAFFNTLEGKTICYHAYNSSIFKEGEAVGKLWGGNLSTLCALCGTNFIPNEDLILFLEDLNEPVYKIDKMLTQLFNIDKLRKNVRGIAIGEFKDIEDKNQLDEVILELANKLNIPICDGFKITHNKIKDTLPIGIKVYFNANAGIIKILEDYCK